MNASLTGSTCSGQFVRRERAFTLKSLSHSAISTSASSSSHGSLHMRRLQCIPAHTHIASARHAAAPTARLLNADQHAARAAANEYVVLASSTRSIRYDTRCRFNVRSKADMSQLSLLHGNDGKKWRKTEKLKSKNGYAQK